MFYEEVLKFPEKAEKLLAKYHFNNLAYKDTPNGNIYDLKRWIENVKPDVVVIDQFANFEIPKQFNRVEGLAYMIRRIRDLAKEFNIVCINVGQAADSADNKLNLDMNDFDFSNTGVPGGVDIMIGVGSNSEYRAQNRRRISLPKTKNGAEDVHVHDLPGSRDPADNPLSGIEIDPFLPDARI